MAGGLLKGFGFTFLTLGVLLLLVGIGAAAYGWFDSEQEKDKGLFADGRRIERDEQLMVGGLVAAAAGVVLTVLGIILAASGSGRANRAIVKAVHDNGTSKSSTVSGKSSKGVAKEASTPPAAPSTAKPNPQRYAVGFALFAVALLLVAAALFLAFDSGSGPLTLHGNDRSRDNEKLGEATVAGRVSSGPTIMGTSTLTGDGKPAEDFTAPAGTGYLSANVTWTPNQSCCRQLEVELLREEAGAWKRIGTWTGSPGFGFNLTLDGVGEGGADLRLRVWPGEDGFSTGQDYSVRVAFWTAPPS